MTTIWDNLELTGTSIGGWEYNDSNLTYNQAIDPDSGEPVLYNGVGFTSSWGSPSLNSTTTANSQSLNSTSWSNINLI